MGETGINIIIGVVVLLFLGLNIYVKSRRSLKSPLGRVALILTNINHNVNLVENFSFHHGVGKMRTNAWQKNEDKIDLLPQELRMALSQVFEMCEEVNGRIDAARKFKSDSYMAGIDISKLKAPLADSQKQLQEWLQANMQNPEYQPKRRRGLFS